MISVDRASVYMGFSSRDNFSDFNNIDRALVYGLVLLPQVEAQESIDLSRSGGQDLETRKRIYNCVAFRKWTETKITQPDIQLRTLFCCIHASLKLQNLYLHKRSAPSSEKEFKN